MIDIFDIEKSIKIIDEVIGNNLADINAAAIEKAKQLVLHDYNLFNMVIDEVQQMDPNAEKKQLTIKQDTAFFDTKKFKVMLFDRIKNKFTI